MHHSLRPEHIDTNFATVFSFWDILFRTQYMGWDEYPSTGIGDRDFPLEQRPTPGRLAASYGRQLVYPFVQVGRDSGIPAAPARPVSERVFERANHCHGPFRHRLVTGTPPVGRRVHQCGSCPRRHGRDVWALVATCRRLRRRLHRADGRADAGSSADLDSDLSTVQWVLNGYSLTLAVLIVLAGRLADMHGRRRLFFIGAGLFTVASLAAALAPGIGVLLPPAS